jgi:hypothetical protein
LTQVNFLLAILHVGWGTSTGFDRPSSTYNNQVASFHESRPWLSIDYVSFGKASLP